MNNRLIYPAAIGIVLAILAGCAGLEGFLAKPEARIESLEIKDIDFGSATILVNVEVDNPNPIGLSLDAYDYSLAAWDASLADGRIEERTSIMADGKSILPVPVTLDFADLASIGTSAVNADSIPLDIALGLEIEIPYTGTARLDLSASIDVPVPRPPRIVPSSLNVERITLTGASISLVLNTENPNAYAMDIRSLSGTLNVGGRDWGQIGLNDRVNMVPEGRQTAVVNLQVSFADIGRSAWDLLSGSGNAQVKLDGTMDVDLDLPGFNGSGVDMDADARVSIIR